MATRNTPPPVFSEDISWLVYKKELKIWQALTDLPAKKQGPSLYLSLTGRAREAALELDIGDISKDDGVEKILQRLDKLYLQDTNQSAYLAYQEFENFKRPLQMSMREYLNNFEKLYTKIKAHRMELPDGVRAYRVLNSANLSEEEMKLCRATLTTLKYDSMVEQLLKIFGDTVSPSFGKSDVKEESVFVASNEEKEVYYSNRWRGGRDFGRFERGGRPKRRGRNQFEFKASKEFSARKLNPLDSRGKPSRCNICESKFHWARNCPDAYENQKQESEISLFQSSDDKLVQMKVFVGETLNCAVLDSGCTQTVCGNNWLKCFKESMQEGILIEEKPSHATFKFGNGDAVISSKKVVLPVTIGSKNVKLETDVVDTEIPLLMSKAAMKKANTVLDFDQDRVIMCGEEQTLMKRSSGHYAIPITKSRQIIEQGVIDNEFCLLSKNITIKDDKEKIVLKLHKQFCHCSSDRLKRLIKASEIWKEDIEILNAVDKVTENCQICKIYKRAPPRPVVGLPLASDFNHTVAMDLITYKQGTWILHLIDVFSRFSVACVRNSKKQDAIVDAVLKTWISYFGQPQRFLADNGGEFANEEYKSMCEMFNIEMAKTAAESPWSNGLCERHNGVIEESIRKVMEENADMSLETAVVWSVSAKNTLINNSGYSPNMIVFGRHPNTPSVLINKLPAMENEATSVTVEKNLKALHKAREAVIQSDSSENIKRALRHNVRTCNDIKFHQGECVYYKRNNNERWHGPGTVIGQDHKQNLVKHGNDLVRVHSSRLVHVDTQDKEHQDDEIDLTPQDKHSESQEITVLNQEPSGSHMPEVTERAQESDAALETEHAVRTTIDSGLVKANSNLNEKKICMLPRIKSTITFRARDDIEWRKGVIHSKAGKATGKYRSCLNVENKETGEIKCYDFERDISEWSPVTEEVLLSNNLDEMSVVMAKEKELENWKRNNVFTEVPDENQPHVTCRWVITTKEVNGSYTTKARLVARGFEDTDVRNQKTDSRPCSKECIRIALAIMARKEWECKVLDVKTAFLQGNELKRDIYLKPPKEARVQGMWKLNKAVYGLNEASRYWYERVKDVLVNAGMLKSKYDEAMFY